MLATEEGEHAFTKSYEEFLDLKAKARAKGCATSPSPLKGDDSQKGRSAGSPGGSCPSPKGLRSPAAERPWSYIASTSR